MILDFNKPAKVKIDAGFDGAFSDGGYTPQMSTADAQKWRAKRVNAGKEGDRIEIKKAFGEFGTQVVIFVAKDGWNYSAKYEVVSKTSDYSSTTGMWLQETKGLNVRMSMNGPLKLTWDQYQEMNEAINEAWEILNK